MKTSKKPDKKTQELHEKINKFFPDDEQKISLLTTALGMASILEEFVIMNDFLQPNVRAKYAILQIMWLKYMLAMVVNDRMKGTPEVIMEHLPIDEGAWKTDADFEKRLIFIVRKFHEELVKEGKIKTPT